MGALFYGAKAKRQIRFGFQPNEVVRLHYLRITSECELNILHLNTSKTRLSFLRIDPHYSESK